MIDYDTRDVTAIEKQLFAQWKGEPPAGFKPFDALRDLVVRSPLQPELAALDSLNGLMLLVYQALLRKHRIAPRGVVHVGAHTGAELALYLQLGFGRVLLLEPNPILQAPLDRRCGHYNQLVAALTELVDAPLSPDSSWGAPWCIALPCAAGASDAAATLYRTVDTRLSSLLPVAQPAGGSAVHEPIRVPLRALDSILGELDPRWSPRDLDVLWINVQGTELAVLRGATRLLAQCQLVAVELNYDRRYQGECTPAEVDGHLRDHGFLPTFGVGVPEGGMRFYARASRAGVRYQAVEGELAAR